MGQASPDAWKKTEMSPLVSIRKPALAVGAVLTGPHGTEGYIRDAGRMNVGSVKIVVPAVTVPPVELTRLPRNVSLSPIRRAAGVNAPAPASILVRRPIVERGTQPESYSPRTAYQLPPIAWKIRMELGPP